MKTGYKNGHKVAECQDSQTQLQQIWKAKGLVDEWRADTPSEADTDKPADTPPVVTKETDTPKDDPPAVTSEADTDTVVTSETGTVENNQSVEPQETGDAKKQTKRKN